MLIVHATPNNFEIIQIADHDLFDGGTEALAEYEKHINDFLLSKNPNGGFYIGGAGGGMQNLAGSSIESTFNQIGIRKILQYIEISNGGIESHVRNLYQKIHNRNPEYVNPEWRMLGREISIYDKKNKEQFNGVELYAVKNG